MRWLRQAQELDNVNHGSNPPAAPATSIGDLSELSIEISGIGTNHARQCERTQRHLSVGAFFALHQGFTMFKLYPYSVPTGLLSPWSWLIGPPSSLRTPYRPRCVSHV